MRVVKPKRPAPGGVTSSGGSIPLKSVAEITFGSGPVTVQRTNQVYRVAVGADLTNPDDVAGLTKKIEDQKKTIFTS